MTGIYELPFGPGRALLKKGVLSHVTGNWQVALTYDFQQGPFLTWGNNFYYGDLSKIGETLTQGTKTLNQSLNTAPHSRGIPPMGRRPTGRVFPIDTPACGRTV